jgi:hypothetical protein
LHCFQNLQYFISLAFPANEKVIADFTHMGSIYFDFISYYQEEVAADLKISYLCSLIVVHSIELD